MPELVRGDILDEERSGTSGAARDETITAVPEHDVGVDDAATREPRIGRRQRGAARRVAEHDDVDAVVGVGVVRVVSPANENANEAPDCAAQAFAPA